MVRLAAAAAAADDEFPVCRISLARFSNLPGRLRLFRFVTDRARTRVVVIIRAQLYTRARARTVENRVLTSADDDENRRDDNGDTRLGQLNIYTRSDRARVTYASVCARVGRREEKPKDVNTRGRINIYLCVCVCARTLFGGRDVLGWPGEGPLPSRAADR